MKQAQIQFIDAKLWRLRNYRRLTKREIRKYQYAFPAMSYLNIVPKIYDPQDNAFRMLHLAKLRLIKVLGITVEQIKKEATYQDCEGNWWLRIIA